MNNPTVSVILATRNEQANIGRCIESIRKQTYPNLEIVNVDNASSDQTRRIATELLGAECVFNLPEHVDLAGIKNYRGAQVNLGVTKTSGDILFFPDADMTFDSELLAEVVALIGQFDALCVPEVIVGKGYIGAIRNFERGFYNLTCIDAPRFVRRSLYQSVGGFDERRIAFGPDDWDLAKRLKSGGARVGLTKSRKFHHESEMSMAQYLAKKMNYTRTFDDYIAKWGKNDPDIRKQFGLWYRLFGVFLEQGKWHRLVSKPHLAVGMYGLRFAVGFAYLHRRNRDEPK